MNQLYVESIESCSGLPAKMEARVDTSCLLYNQKNNDNNLKTKNNQNWQQIELYGSPTTKEIKKHSSRPVGGAESDAGGEDSRQGSGWQTQRGGGLWNGAGQAAAGWWGISWRTRWQTTQPRAPAPGNKASNLWLKTPVGLRQQQEKLPASKERWLERPTGC